MNTERNVYAEVNTFLDKCYANDNNYSYAAGVMSSVLINALEYLPKNDREMLLDRLINITELHLNGSQKAKGI